jgi:hypothetical protein
VVGVVSLLTDLSRERMNPLPVVVAGLVPRRAAASTLGRMEGPGEANASWLKRVGRGAAPVLARDGLSTRTRPLPSLATAGTARPGPAT